MGALVAFRSTARVVLRVALASVATAAAACIDNAPPSNAVDAGVDAPPGEVVDAAVDAGEDTTASSPQVCEDAAQLDSAAIREQIRAEVPCFSGMVQTQMRIADWCQRGPWNVTPYFTTARLTLCDPPGDFEKRLQAATIAKLAPPPERVQPTYLKIDGGIDTEGQTIADAFTRQCGFSSWYPAYFEIEIDANGRVVAVHGADDGGVRLEDVDGGSTDVRACLEQALRELTFPCLAGARVCPQLPRI